MEPRWPPGDSPPSPSRLFNASAATQRGESVKATTVNFRLEPDLLLAVAEIGNRESLNLSETCRFLLREGVVAYNNAHSEERTP